MRASIRERRGTSLIEILVAITILALSLIPIIDLYVASRRIGHSAGRLVDVSLHAQLLLEALAQLEPADFPPIASGAEAVLISDTGATLGGAGTAAFADVARAFEGPTPLPMERTVFASALASGELALRIEVSWRSIEGEEATRQLIDLHMLATPRPWQ